MLLIWNDGQHELYFVIMSKQFWFKLATDSDLNKLNKLKKPLLLSNSPFNQRFLTHPLLLFFWGAWCCNVTHLKWWPAWVKGCDHLSGCPRMSWLRDKCRVSFSRTTAIAREIRKLSQRIGKYCSEDDTLTKQTHKQINVDTLIF